MNMDEVKIVEKFYDDNTEGEWKRLDGFKFEFEITKAMLKKHMKKGSVLDIGGGPGRYSLYLASIGYEVTLVDLSKNNVEFAKIKSKELGLNIQAYQCDARNLSSLNLGTYDNILLMGPLYHLFELSDRKKVIFEAKSHLNNNGLIFTSFISINAGFNYYLSDDPNGLINERSSGFIESAEINKSWAGKAFTEAYFIETDEIETLLNECGIQKITMFGQEGITATRLQDLQKAPQEVQNYWLETSLKFCENEKYFVYSSHIMFIGKIKV